MNYCLIKSDFNSFFSCVQCHVVINHNWNKGGPFSPKRFDCQKLVATSKIFWGSELFSRPTPPHHPSILAFFCAFPKQFTGPQNPQITVSIFFPSHHSTQRSKLSLLFLSSQYAEQQHQNSLRSWYVFCVCRRCTHSFRVFFSLIVAVVVVDDTNGLKCRFGTDWPCDCKSVFTKRFPCHCLRESKR